MMVRLLVVVLISLAGLPASADPVKPNMPGPEPRELGEQLMKFAVADDMRGLFLHMGTMSPMEKSKLETWRDGVMAQRKTVLPALGAAAGSAFVSECRRGDLSRLLFAEKRALSPMRWKFIFYRARDKWQLVYFFWDDKIADFFEPCN